MACEALLMPLRKGKGEIQVVIFMFGKIYQTQPHVLCPLSFFVLPLVLCMFEYIVHQFTFCRNELWMNWSSVMEIVYLEFLSICIYVALAHTWHPQKAFELTMSQVAKSLLASPYLPWNRFCGIKLQRELCMDWLGALSVSVCCICSTWPSWAL